MRRRPAPSGPQPPERLRRFDAAEWQVPDPMSVRVIPLSTWEAEHWHLLGPLQAWRCARWVWSAAHGDALGDCVERLHFERAVRRALVERITEENAHGG